MSLVQSTNKVKIELGHKIRYFAIPKYLQQRVIGPILHQHSRLFLAKFDRMRFAIQTALCTENNLICEL